VNKVVKITDDQWAEYLERLTYHITKKFFWLGWGNPRNGYSGPEGKEPTDIALEVISRVIDENRIYNSGAYTDFMHFLRSAADSIINHLTEKKKKKVMQSLSHECTEAGDCLGDRIPGHEPDPAITSMNKDLLSRIRKIIMRKFANDDVVMKLLDCFDAGIFKRSEVSEYLDMPVKEYDNAMKRLRREVLKHN